MKKKSHNHKYHDTGKLIYLDYTEYQFYYEQQCKCGRKRLRKGKRKIYEELYEIETEKSSG